MSNKYKHADKFEDVVNFCLSGSGVSLLVMMTVTSTLLAADSITGTWPTILDDPTNNLLLGSYYTYFVIRYFDKYQGEDQYFDSIKGPSLLNALITFLKGSFYAILAPVIIYCIYLLLLWINGSL